MFNKKDQSKQNILVSLFGKDKKAIECHLVRKQKMKKTLAR